MKSVKRTTENGADLAATSPAVRFTDYDPSAPHPSSELLGYFQSSAMRTDRTTFCAKLWRLNAGARSGYSMMIDFSRLGLNNIRADR